MRNGIGTNAQLAVGTERRIATCLAIACLLFSGCFGSGKQATDQLRSALSFDRVPEQYEPPIEDAEDGDWD